MKPRKLNRREILAVVGGSAALSIAAADVIAQAPAASPASSGEDWYKESIQSHKENSDVLARFEIQMSLEPAFQFKA